MKAALPRCGRCGAALHVVDQGGRCWSRDASCLWRRALAKWRLPRARAVLERIEARRRGNG